MKIEEKNYKIEFFSNCPKAMVTRIDKNKPFYVDFIEFSKMGYTPLFMGVCGYNKDDAIMLIKTEAL